MTVGPDTKVDMCVVVLKRCATMLTRGGSAKSIIGKCLAPVMEFQRPHEVPEEPAVGLRVRKY